ncbi:MAG: formate--tetrahydrofolate ligase, partial [Clostridia bacterium]|nr:formate--tetrahydrofolate ligase [Clostridia bacterium]
IYGAEDVEFSEEAIKSIDQIKKLGFGNLPVCIAKTQYSFSDDPKNLECTEKFNIHAREVILKAGAGFIVVITGKIMTMPGLPKIPAAESIDINENGDIEGIF